MLNGLNKYGLPTKYGFVVAFLSNMLGLSNGSTTYIMIPIAAGVGGAVGGWLSHRKGKNSLCPSRTEQFRSRLLNNPNWK